jgi:hypothetical protein
MKISLPEGHGLRAKRQQTLAFTLSEMMISMTILTMVLAGVLTSHLFGVKMLEITKAKLGASDEARRAISKLVSEIRSAKSILVGTGNTSSFTEAVDGSLQQGTAIQIYASTNTNYYVRYFWDSSDKQLKRSANGSSATSVVAQSLTNSLLFTSEDFAGSVITDNQNNRVIGVTLEFYQIQYPIILVGPGNYYDFYRLRTRITRRTLE